MVNMKEIVILSALTVLNALLVLPLLFLAGLLGFFWRTVVQVLARFFRPDLCIMSGLTVSMALEPIESRSSSNIISIATCKNISIEKLKLLFCQRVLCAYDSQGQLYKRMCQTYTQFLGYNFWRWEEKFDLDDHVKLYEKTDPGLSLPRNPTEEDLRRVSGKLVTQAFKKGTSPWEFYLIENYEHSGQCCLLLRTHHALADGFSLYELGCALQGATIPKKVTKISISSSIIQSVKVACRLPYDYSKMIMSYNTTSQWLGPRGQLSRSFRTLWSDPIEWNQIKSIMKNHGVSSNAAVYSIVAAATHRIIKSAKNVHIPRTIYAASPYPLSNHPGRLTNYLSISSFEFPSRLCGKKELIDYIGKQVKNSKEFTTQPYSFYFIWSILLMLPTNLLRYVQKGVPGAPWTLTNTFMPVPSANDDFEMEFSKLSLACPSTSTEMALIANVVTSSSNAATRFILTADEAILPDSDGISGDFKRIILEEMQRYGCHSQPRTVKQE